MSTYYDLVCVEHKESAGFHWCGYDSVKCLLFIAENLSRWIYVAEFYRMADQRFGWMFGYGELKWGAESGPSAPELAEFAKKHRNCTVKPQDQYGSWHDQCQLRILCKECGKHDDCSLREHHEGECKR